MKMGEHDNKSAAELAKEVAEELKNKLTGSVNQASDKIKAFDLKGKFEIFASDLKDKSNKFKEASKELIEKYKK